MSEYSDVFEAESVATLSAILERESRELQVLDDWRAYLGALTTRYRELRKAGQQQDQEFEHALSLQLKFAMAEFS